MQSAKRCQMIKELPAPNEMLELTMCGCKSNCSTHRCKCRRYRMMCTDACKCNDCENTHINHVDEETDLSDDSDSDDEFECIQQH